MQMILGLFDEEEGTSQVVRSEDQRDQGDLKRVPPKSSGAKISEIKATNASSPSDIWKRDRKSTRLNSGHLGISHAVFCLKKRNELRAGAFAGIAGGCGGFAGWPLAEP